MRFTVTITTCNRAQSLGRGLEALARQTYALDDVEIIVADNGSSDGTKSVAYSFSAKFPHFRYLYDARPGQLVGWHRALAIAQGEIICFIDDDVRPGPGWLAALADAYQDPRVGLATGPIRLAFDDSTPPDWLETMTLGDAGSQTMPFLGGLDLGTAVRDIPGNFVWGTNFSVRRSVLLEVEGFHPGAMPWALIRFYGDGEIHVGRTAQQRGHRILYHPGAVVEHHIPASRLTMDAVVRKFTTTGCARAFQTLRAAGQNFVLPTAGDIRAMAHRYFRDAPHAPGELVQAVETGLQRGLALQHASFDDDPHFRAWVQRPNYLDLDSCYTHPDFFAAPATMAQDWRSGT